MRTTIAIDDDVLLAVKERARRQRRSAGAVLSELARQSLTQAAPSPARARRGGFHGFHPLPHRGAPVSNALLDQLREDEPE